MSAIPHAIPTPISFDAARFVAVEEAASLLEIDAGNLRRKCRDELAQLGLAVRIVPPEGGQEKWLIHRDYNPRLIGGDFATLYRESDLSSLSMKQQQGARNRRLCVEELRRDRRDRPGAMTTWLPALIGALQQRFPELVVSRTRLYCWDGVYQRPCDLVKLVDQRGGDRRSQGGPEGWKAFKDLYLHPNQPSVKQCWREVQRLARENEWVWCSLKSCHAQMDRV